MYNQTSGQFQVAGAIGQAGGLGIPTPKQLPVRDVLQQAREMLAKAEEILRSVYNNITVVPPEGPNVPSTSGPMSLDSLAYALREQAEWLANLANRIHEVV